jgi:hypothetical protein
LTPKQLEFWLSVKPNIESISNDAKQSLRVAPVGYSIVFRLPERFHLRVGEPIQFDRQAPMLMVMKSPDGLLASEYKIHVKRKGYTPPKPRLIAAVNW